VTAPFRWLLRERATIFMLHRFALPELGVWGDQPEQLRSGLAYLRRHGHVLISLEEIFQRLSQGTPLPRRAVAFTIDDGYFDQVEIAAPIFAEFDCPVTTFVCTGFLDRELWMWWDRIEYVLRRTEHRDLQVQLGQQTWTGSWSDSAERLRLQSDFTERCKALPDAEKQAAIEQLAKAAEVALPAEAPAEYAPMSWEDLRRAERGGMSFAPHTVTHPVLSRTPDQQARREIELSRDRLASEAAGPEAVFCYPNGQRGDFGSREFRILGELGFLGAVVGYLGHASPGDFHSEPDARFCVRRYSYPSDLPGLIQCVTGIERFKSMLRGGD
jgi:peptidoglycan/xylan/chitin deacetylase (PgdA/CDA1 family)